MTNLQCPKCKTMDAVAPEFCRKCGVQMPRSQYFRLSIVEDLPNTDEFGTEGLHEAASIIRPFNGMRNVASPSIVRFARNVVLTSKIILGVYLCLSRNRRQPANLSQDATASL